MADLSHPAAGATPGEPAGGGSRASIEAALLAAGGADLAVAAEAMGALAGLAFDHYSAVERADVARAQALTAGAQARDPTGASKLLEKSQDFWCELADKEAELGPDDARCRHHVAHAVPALVPWLWGSLIRQPSASPPDARGEEDWSHSIGAGSCLRQVFQAAPAACFAAVMDPPRALVSAENLASPDWHVREVSASKSRAAASLLCLPATHRPARAPPRRLLPSHSAACLPWTSLRPSQSALCRLCSSCYRRW